MQAIAYYNLIHIIKALFLVTPTSPVVTSVHLTKWLMIEDANMTRPVRPVLCSNNCLANNGQLHLAILGHSYIGK